MPAWLFERFAGTNETTMWRWLGSNDIDLNIEPTLELHPDALNVRAWLNRQSALRSEPTGAPRAAEGTV